MNHENEEKYVVILLSFFFKKGIIMGLIFGNTRFNIHF